MSDPLERMICGDCREILPTLEAGSVQCCVSSPPYWGLRDYGTAEWEGGLLECDHKFDHSKREAKARNFVNGEGRLTTACSSWTTRSESEFHRDCPKCGARRIDSQLGLEATPEEYIANMVAVFRAVWRVLRDDGTLWLNMGDSYGQNQGNGFDTHEKIQVCTPEQRKRYQDRKALGASPKVKTGLKPKDLCMMPARLAMALQADGWYLRSEIVWHKPNPMPESVTDRPTKAHEMIYLLAKQERYFYDAEAIREPADKTGTEKHLMGANGARGGTREGLRGRPFGNLKADPLEGSHGTLGMDGNGMRMPEKWNNPAGRNKRTVWTIATQPYSQAHFATFPEEIPKLCILAGSRPGDVILDPFTGSGTTGKVAIELGRKVILIKLNPEYMRLARARTWVTPGFF
jgi:DNA modification methylase